MSRSLFARLAHRHRPTTPSERREFLKASLALGAGLLLSRRAVAGAIFGRTPSAKKVVVVGGGFAGLACAYELNAAGHDVTVVEATGTVGGRVMSLNDANGNALVAGKNVEAGGELIGSNHPLWVTYAEKFGLSFLDVSESEMDYPLYLGGTVISGEESSKLYEEFEAALTTMDADAQNVDADTPWTHSNAASLDKRTLADWLNDADASDLAKSAIAAQLAGDNGVANDRASYLGMLAAIKGGGLDKYWTQSEVYRCKGGNQQLAKRFASELGERVITRLSVRSIDIADKGNVKVVCSDGRTLECDSVVVAVAPSVWQRITFTPALPKELTRSGPANLGVQMGTNTKFLSPVKSRFWESLNLDPTCLSDDQFSWSWDATAGQDDNAGDDATKQALSACLTAFAGGPVAERVRAQVTESRAKAYADTLEKIFKGYSEHKAGKPVFMDWPGFPFVGAGYSFPAPGQVTTVAPLLSQGHHNDKLHFAGEACCLKFVGYMEGALQSGVSVANRIVES